MTVYDSHLAELQEAEGDVVFGATNPLFLKLFARDNIRVMRLGQGKTPRHLRPLRELFVQSKLEEQRAVNESALRKFFYKVNCGIIAVLD